MNIIGNGASLPCMSTSKGTPKTFVVTVLESDPLNCESNLTELNYEKKVFTF